MVAHQLLPNGVGGIRHHGGVGHCDSGGCFFQPDGHGCFDGRAAQVDQDLDGKKEERGAERLPDSFGAQFNLPFCVLKEDSSVAPSW